MKMETEYILKLLRVIYNIMDKIKRKIYIDKIIKVMKNDYPLFHNLKLYGFYDQLSNVEMDYVFSGVFEQPVRVVEYIIYNDEGKRIYYEDSTGYWEKNKYDENGNMIYYEFSDGFWIKSKYDENGNEIYFENSEGYWTKYEYDNNHNEIYYETSDGEIEDKR